MYTLSRIMLVPATMFTACRYRAELHPPSAGEFALLQNTTLPSQLQVCLLSSMSAYQRTARSINAGKRRRRRAHRVQWQR